MGWVCRQIALLGFTALTVVTGCTHTPPLWPVQVWRGAQGLPDRVATVEVGERNWLGVSVASATMIFNLDGRPIAEYLGADRLGRPYIVSQGNSVYDFVLLPGEHTLDVRYFSWGTYISYTGKGSCCITFTAVAGRVYRIRTYFPGRLLWGAYLVDKTTTETRVAECIF